jgi:hypothetical protein
MLLVTACGDCIPQTSSIISKQLLLLVDWDCRMGAYVQTVARASTDGQHARFTSSSMHVIAVLKA